MELLELLPRMLHVILEHGVTVTVSLKNKCKLNDIVTYIRIQQVLGLWYQHAFYK